MKTALIQMAAGADKAANVAKAAKMSSSAIAEGAQLIVLPEVFNFRGDSRNPEILAQVSESIPGPSLQPLMALAKAYQCAFIAGSIYEADQGKVYNTCVYINAHGELCAKYRKINLFDAALGNRIIRESDCFCAGSDTAVVDQGDFKIGFSICYDLRFPTLYEGYRQQGVSIIAAPSCFTQTTGQSHWEILVRARAIENLAYVLACNQVGPDFRGMNCFGHSMIVSPWGEILAQASGEHEEIIYADLDATQVRAARLRLPGIVKSKN